jgi:hypothetical protein
MLPILFLGITLALYGFFWRKTRTELNYEKEKHDFLLNKFKYLLQSRNEKVTNLTVHIPRNENRPWKVFKTVKSGMWPFDEENDIEVYSIMDGDLEKDILKD